MKPRIGLDCQKILSPNGQGAGVEHYVYHLATNLAAQPNRFCELVVFLHPRLQGSAVARQLRQAPAVKVVFFPAGAIERRSFWPFSKYRQQARFFSGFQLDLLHGPANVTPPFYRGKTVVTVHDLIIYDHPEWFPGGSAGVFWRWILVPRALKRASRLIAVSQATKMQIINRFRIDKELIDVVYEGGTGWEGGSGLSNIMTAHNIRPPFLLYVGTLEPRKNLVRLLEAFAALCARRGAWQLVLAGKYGWKYEPILSAVKQLNLASHVILTGYIKPADKQVLYQKAAGLAYPSLAEGFGLPVLEAMQAGLPVLTSNLSSLPEVAGSAAIMVDPYSVESIKSGLEKLMFDEPLRCRLVNDGRRQATKFSWSIAAKQTLSIYQKLTMSNGQA